MTKEELIKILGKTCTPAEMDSLRAWLTSGRVDEDLERYISEDLEKLHENEDAHKDYDLDHLVSGILEKARTEERKKAAAEALEFAKKREGSSWNYILRIAAVFILIISSVFAYRFYIQETLSTGGSLKLITKENDRGRKSTIFLADGTVVYLNAESKITFPEKFSDTLRAVSLLGEAYFEVTKNKQKPFIVHAGDVNIAVLGTSFNINAYPDNEALKVSLKTGRVSVTATAGKVKNKSIYLEPGESVSYLNRQKRFSEITTFDADLDLGWKDGKMVFKNADLNSIITRLERWYNVDFILENEPFFAWNYTGEFQDQSIRDVLESLSFSQRFDYTVRGNQIRIKFKPN